MSRPVTPNSPALPAASNRLLTNADFARLAEVGRHENQHTSQANVSEPGFGLNVEIISARRRWVSGNINLFFNEGTLEEVVIANIHADIG